MAANTDAGSSQSSDNIWWIKSENEQTECQDSELKTRYYEQLMEFYESKQMAVKKPWTMKRILEVIELVKSSKMLAATGQRRTSMQYYWVSKYDVFDGEGAEYLIMKKNKPQDPTIRVIPLEQYFDLLLEIHIEHGHAGRDKMIFMIKNKFYVQKKAVEIFISICPTCEKKRRIQQAKRSQTTNFNSSGQVDLIDFESMPDQDYKWLLKYQDSATKFLQLYPLCSNQASEIALQLVKIFLTFGPPSVLISNNKHIVEEVNKIWPDSHIHHGTSLPPSEDQDNLELNNKDIEDMLHSWIQENGSTNWSLGCHFIQYRLNTSTQISEGKSSYRTLFGCDPKSNCGNIPADHLEINMNTEEEGNKGVKRAAEETKDEVIVKKTPLKIGDIVNISVPKLDRGPLNTKFIVGKITDFNNGVYQVGTKSGIIKNWFHSNELQIANVEFTENVSPDLLTLKEAVTKQTLYDNVQLNKCTCKPSKNQCRSLKCACFKKKVLCGSKCHSNLVCVNK